MFWNHCKLESCCVCTLDAECELDSTCSTLTLPQQPPVTSSDVNTQNDDITAEACTPEVGSPSTAEAASSSLSAAVPSDQPAADETDVDDVNVPTDSEHIVDDEFEADHDETLYHDCISASFVGRLLCSRLLPILYFR